jgi:CRISPR-associated Csx10 family RAMP protein
MEATLRSPLVVRRDRQSERSEGVDFLSGSLVRGALAQAWLQQHGGAEGDFARVFLDETACRFGPLDPAARVAPLTAVSCKRHPGFRADFPPERPDKAPHGVADQLWLRVARRLTGAELPADLAEAARQCGHPGCGQDLKAFPGFWDLDGQTPRGRGERRQGLAVHVGIDRVTHTAAEAMFYTLHAVEPALLPDGDGDESDPDFVGELEAEPDVAGILLRLLEENGGTIDAGHARTRGYGRVSLTLREAPAAAPASPEEWSRDLVNFLRSAPLALTDLDPERCFFFSLALPTGAVLVDELLRYTLDPAHMVPWLPPLPPPDPAERTRSRPGRTGPGGGELWCVTAVTRHERVRGWNAAHGLPRQDEWAVSRGAVYAYLFQGDAARAALLAELTELEQQGVGARRNEGFGRVHVSDDFHRRFHQQEKA